MVTDDMKNRPPLENEKKRQKADEPVPEGHLVRKDADSPDKIAKIREILFGVQMREYEERFSVLEQGMRQEIAELRTSLDRRSEALEKRIRADLSELKDRMAQEERRRNALLEDLRHALDTRDAALNERLGKLETRLTKNAATLQKQLISHSENVDATLRRNNEQAKAVLRQLEMEKVGRLTLSEFFNEMAMGLTRDPSEKPETESENLKNG